MTMMTSEAARLGIEPNVYLRRPHEFQRLIRRCKAKRIIIRAGRRGGKTVIVALIAIDWFSRGYTVLYVAPTVDQMDTFWREVKRALSSLVAMGALYKNESTHLIENLSSGARIRAKTAWNPDMLRGDFADLLILDEWQLQNELIWSEVGAPMLLDNNGSAIFIYTPRSLHSRSVSKARDPRHAAKLFKYAETHGPRWATFHFSSHANPYISTEALSEITEDMTAAAIRQEIEAEDTEDVPGALWNREMLDSTRVKITDVPDLVRLVVAVDPPGGATECGIVAAGKGTDGQAYVMVDASLRASPDVWAGAVVDTYQYAEADRVVAEANFGGDMVKATVDAAAKARGTEVVYRAVNASRGKAVRAEPVAALYEQGRVHHVGEFPLLEEELCMWVPGETRESPNRLDALVWAMTDLMLGKGEARLRFL